ncbi:CBS domain-containing protein [Bowdeniella nasicola]|uniref:CBS domain-containing protein n=1 Tax=Bowdeniella nasicola TaxID=208480 RepID=A0A1H4C0B5_9ACTO|nr:CBS domain-containing protein [Bowdeniella nasicola]SEA53522.1 CBS domain-containing protein [Bowdeniella nasicola]
MRVEDIVKKKGTDVVTLTSDSTISQLLSTLSKHSIGAVVVVDNDQVVGIVSERDVVRRIAETGSVDGQVSQIMTSDLETCVNSDEIQTLASKMTERRIRHLPVMDGDTLVAIVSIGDVVKSRLDDLEAERDHLHGFVHG